jgi:CBS domain-containing protein
MHFTSGAKTTNKEPAMATVDEIIARKGGQVHTIEGSVTVLEATKRMNQQKVGALVVTGGGRVVGIFTERDVLRRIVAEQRAPAEVLVSEVMTEDVMCVTPDTDIDEAASIMQAKRIRHLPVCDGEGSLLGIVSIGDLNAQHASHREQQIHFLNDYIYGRV